jgi:DNA-binding winged helix-turn-helix (wHTH) protein
MDAENTGLFEFGEFRLNTRERTLTRDGAPVPLAPKVFDTLEILVVHHGCVISKQELMDTLWPNSFVELSNLSQNIYTLRKALGNGQGSGHLIENLPRLGYRFNADVRRVDFTLRPDKEGELREDETVQGSAALIPTGKSRFSSPRLPAVAAFGVLVLAVLTYFFFARNSLGPEPVSAANSPKPEAMQAYTRGKMILGRRDSENRPEKAIDEFQKAVTIDPTFALAYSGLAEGFHAVAHREAFPASEDYNAKAKAAADRALELDPNLSEAHVISGWLKRSNWDWAGAEAGLRKAIQLNSKSAPAHQRLAILLSSLSRHDEALSELKIAYALDPIADGVLGARVPILEARRDYEAGLSETEKLYLENKNNTQMARAYATFLYHAGVYAKVIELGEDVLNRDANKAAFAWHSLMHAAYYKSLQQDKADEHLRHLEAMAAKDTKAAYSLAMNYAELGRVDEAIKLIEDCHTRHEERVMWMNVEPRFENLRTHERFQDLLRKLKFV